MQSSSLGLVAGVAHDAPSLGMLPHWACSLTGHAPSLGMLPHWAWRCGGGEGLWVTGYRGGYGQADAKGAVKERSIRPSNASGWIELCCCPLLREGLTPWPPCPQVPTQLPPSAPQPPSPQRRVDPLAPRPQVPTQLFPSATLSSDAQPQRRIHTCPRVRLASALRGSHQVHTHVRARDTHLEPRCQVCSPPYGPPCSTAGSLPTAAPSGCALQRSLRDTHFSPRHR